MSFLLISVGKRVGGESINEDNIFTYKKIFVLVLRSCTKLSLNVYSHASSLHIETRDTATRCR